MPPRPKRLKSLKKGSKSKGNRTMHPLQDPVSSDSFVTEEDAPTLRDVLDAIDSLVTCETANESRIAQGRSPTIDTAPARSTRTQASTSANPPEAGPGHPEALPPVETEGLPQVEDQVRSSIVDRLIEVPTTYLHLIEDESDREDTTPADARRKNPEVSNKLRTIDTTVVKLVRWPYYRRKAQPKNGMVI